jgi:hypothetical protein
MVPTKEAIGITELVLFVTLPFITCYLSYRFGFFKHLAWLWLTFFANLRIASAALLIASALDPSNINEAIWAAILGSIGLSPLLLCTMSLLKMV